MHLGTVDVYGRSNQKSVIFVVQNKSYLSLIVMTSSVSTTKYLTKNTLTTHSQYTQNPLVSYAQLPQSYIF
jgi:hypothetical protein